MPDFLQPVLHVAGFVAGCPKKLAQMGGNKLEKSMAVDPATRSPLMKQLDGQFLSCATCSTGAPCGKSAAPNAAAAKGKRPDGCTASKLPKKLFVNGINNTPEDNCKTAKALANISCSEVVSFYNSTDGMGADLSECITNIKRTDNPAAQNLADYISANMDDGVDIVAHSQGGLITRQALTALQKEMVTDGISADEATAAMSKIKVTSCGTARSGWPAGPSYTQYTNSWDLVPRAISAGDTIYGYDTATVTAKEADIVRNTFTAVPTKKAIAGLPGHGMEGVYLPQMKKDAANGSKLCKCK